MSHEYWVDAEDSAGYTNEGVNSGVPIGSPMAGQPMGTVMGPVIGSAEGAAPSEEELHAMLSDPAFRADLDPSEGRGISYLLRKQMEKRQQAGGGAPAGAMGAVGQGSVGPPGGRSLQAGQPLGKAFDPLWTPPPAERPTSVAQSSCSPVPQALVRRVREFPQTPRGTGPFDPLPVAFSTSEVQAAVRAVQRTVPWGSPCYFGISSAAMFIAQHVATTLSRWGRSAGWVRSAGRAFHLGDKLYLMRHRKAALTASLDPQPGAIPFDIDSMSTTWDGFVPQESVDDQFDSYRVVQVRGSVNQDGIASGPQTLVVGARANMRGRVDDVLRSIAATGGLPYESDTGAWVQEHADEQAETGPLLNMMNYFPIMQTHSIKGGKHGCGCANKAIGEPCEC